MKNSKVELKCEVDSYPLSEVLWYRHGKHIIEHTNTSDSVSTLTVTLHHDHDYGNYTCKAKNLLGVARVHFVLAKEKLQPAPKDLKIFGRGYNLLDIGFSDIKSNEKDVFYRFEYIAKENYVNENSWKDAKVHETPVGDGKFQIKELKSNSWYLFRVAVNNSLGFSDWSEISEFDTIAVTGEN